MCLAVPGKILDTEEIGDNRIGRIQFGGITRQAYLDWVPEAQVGDYVLVHVGFAMSLLDEDEAQETLAALQAMGEVEPDVGYFLNGGITNAVR